MRLILIDYTNWRGERDWRIIEPTGKIEFEANEWHPLPQWIMYAFDLQKGGAARGFAMVNIHKWVIPPRQTIFDAGIERPSLFDVEAMLLVRALMLRGHKVNLMVVSADLEVNGIVMSRDEARGLIDATS